MGIAPMSSEVFPKYSTSIVILYLLQESRKKTKSFKKLPFAYDFEDERREKLLVSSRWLWHQRFPIGSQGADGCARLGASKSERRSKSRSDCVLGFGDEVCVYHRDSDFYDHAIKIGLPILKVQPVESINNPRVPLSLT